MNEWICKLEMEREERRLKKIKLDKEEATMSLVNIKKAV